MVRRTFLRNLGRGGLLAAIAAAGWIIVSREQVTLLADCTDNFQCRNCSKLKKCSLPEAQITRENHGEEGNR
jgi:hypothetical protein